MTSMLSRIQRDAMHQAQQGHWSLADAIELACPERRTAYRRKGGGFFNKYQLLFGVLVGGRLRQFAYGDPDDEVELITDMNGDVIFDANDDDATPPHCEGDNLLTLEWAEGVIDAHHDALANPTQLPLIAEPA